MSLAPVDLVKNTNLVTVSFRSSLGIIVKRT